MYTIAELRARADASRWRMLSNDGTTLSAKNLVTNEMFTGTSVEFKAMLREADINEVEPSYNRDGTFGGFKDGESDIKFAQVTEDGVLKSSDGSVLSFGTSDLSDVVYDGSDRITSMKLNDITYTIVYASNSMSVTGSNGYALTITKDGSNRITGVS